MALEHFPQGTFPRVAPTEQSSPLRPPYSVIWEEGSVEKGHLARHHGSESRILLLLNGNGNRACAKMRSKSLL